MPRVPQRRAWSPFSPDVFADVFFSSLSLSLAAMFSQAVLVLNSFSQACTDFILVKGNDIKETCDGLPFNVCSSILSGIPLIF